MYTKNSGIPYLFAAKPFGRFGRLRGHPFGILAGDVASPSIVGKPGPIPKHRPCAATPQSGRAEFCVGVFCKTNAETDWFSLRKVQAGWICFSFFWGLGSNTLPETNSQSIRKWWPGLFSGAMLVLGSVCFFVVGDCTSNKTNMEPNNWWFGLMFLLFQVGIFRFHVCFRSLIVHQVVHFPLLGFKHTKMNPFEREPKVYNEV